MHIPDHAMNLIYEFSGLWKTRFTNDVLPEINKGYRLVGLVCDAHRYNPLICDCDMQMMIPCANCYSYGACSNHTHYEMISFEDIKLHHTDFRYLDFKRIEYVDCSRISYEKWSFFNERDSYQLFIFGRGREHPGFTPFGFREVIHPLLSQLKNYTK